MLFREIIASVVRIIRNTMYYVGKVQSFLMLKQVVHTVTIGRVNHSDLSREKHWGAAN
jgi:hypothetical protein